MEPESAKAFTRMLWGYNPGAVDAHVEMMTTKQQLLLDDVESLRARLKDLGDESAALRKEVAVLTDTSPAPHAVQQRMAQMLRRAVDEVAEMQAEAQARSRGAGHGRPRPRPRPRSKNRKSCSRRWPRSESPGSRICGSQGKAAAELAGMRADLQQEREQLLADAKHEADHYREQSRKATEEAMQQRVKVLEQLMGVYRDLEEVPAALESAYQELKNPPDSTG